LHVRRQRNLRYRPNSRLANKFHCTTSWCVNSQTALLASCNNHINGPGVTWTQEGHHAFISDFVRVGCHHRAIRSRANISYVQALNKEGCVTTKRSEVVNNVSVEQSAALELHYKMNMLLITPLSPSW
jgi:hypothetical protein